MSSTSTITQTLRDLRTTLTLEPSPLNAHEKEQFFQHVVQIMHSETDSTSYEAAVNRAFEVLGTTDAHSDHQWHTHKTGATGLHSLTPQLLENSLNLIELAAHSLQHSVPVSNEVALQLVLLREIQLLVTIQRRLSQPLA